MTLPAPHPGLVLRYAFLWSHEADAGRSDAAKDRPCAVVLASRSGEQGAEVLVVPITHRVPDDPDLAVEIPPATRQRLGLDDEPCWIVVSDLNRFLWPGPDLRPTPAGRWDYGVLSPRLFEQVKAKLVVAFNRRRSSIIRREE